MMKKIGVGILLSGWLLTTHAIAQDAGWANQVDNKPENSQQELGDESPTTNGKAMNRLLQTGRRLRYLQTPSTTVWTRPATKLV